MAVSRFGLDLFVFLLRNRFKNSVKGKTNLALLKNMFFFQRHLKNICSMTMFV